MVSTRAVIARNRVHPVAHLIMGHCHRENCRPAAPAAWQPSSPQDLFQHGQGCHRVIGRHMQAAPRKAGPLFQMQVRHQQQLFLGTKQRARHVRHEAAMLPSVMPCCLDKPCGLTDEFVSGFGEKGIMGFAAN